VWKERANEVAAIACSAVDTYEGNRSQIYLTGFSYGGNGVLDIGSLRTDVWAALWPVEPTRWEPVDPKLNPVNIPDQPIWVSAGERARKNHASFTGDWSTVDMDWNYPVPNPHRVYEDKGLNHPDTATEAYRNPYIYNWLLTHSLP
jgi:predicted peptidase